jgi:L-amino acid N-acyltransferase YncA
VLVRNATAEDWPAIWSFMSEIVRAGDTFTYDEDLSEEAARASWMADGRYVTVAVADDGAIVGSAAVYANQRGPGAHIASASYMVDPRRWGEGTGRALVEASIAWARERGFRGMQFNAVVETNEHAVALYRSLGFEIVGTIPGGFHHPTAGYVGLHVMFLAL